MGGHSLVSSYLAFFSSSSSPVFWNFDTNTSYYSTLLLKIEIQNSKGDAFSFKFHILIWAYSSLFFHLRYITVYTTDFYNDKIK